MKGNHDPKTHELAALLLFVLALRQVFPELATETQEEWLDILEAMIPPAETHQNDDGDDLDMDVWGGLFNGVV